MHDADGNVMRIIDAQVSKIHQTKNSVTPWEVGRDVDGKVLGRKHASLGRSEYRGSFEALSRLAAPETNSDADLIDVGSSELVESAPLKWHRLEIAPRWNAHLILFGWSEKAMYGARPKAHKILHRSLFE
ncbi:hypothetical protein WG66_011717 [Moniliophthora roreri]|nr:hypothetical protein WG66_011717 [Moniliophthora roreri]